MENNKFLTSEQMKHLQELGLDIKDDMPYSVPDMFDKMADIQTFWYKPLTPVLTVWGGAWRAGYLFYYDINQQWICHEQISTSALDATYKLFCWCIENGHIKTNKIKQS